MQVVRNVRFVEKGNSDGKLFTDYPFVICVPEIPPGMEIGDDMRVPLSFSGFFIKLWAYRTEFMSGKQPRTGRPQLQLSPLLIGPTVVLERVGVETDPYIGMTLACVFTACLLGIWFVLWRNSIHDDRQTKRLFKKHEPPEGGLDALKDK